MSDMPTTVVTCASTETLIFKKFMVVPLTTGDIF